MRNFPLALLLGGILATAALSAPPAPPLREGDRPLLPRPGLLRALLKAQIGLVADYFWILTINRVGSAETASEHRDIYYYADLTTDLDPRFRKVYTFAGVTIPVQVDRARYANTDESTRLLRKGARNVPEDQRIRFQLAYNLIFFHQQYREAAEILEQLAREPGALPWYGPLATRLYAQSGDLETSLALTLSLRDAVEDDEARASFDRRVREIAQERVLRELDGAIERFRARRGRLPDRVEELVAAGELKEIPPDPLEGEYFVGTDGRAHSTASKFRLEVITDERTETGERVVPRPRTSTHDTTQP